MSDKMMNYTRNILSARFELKKHAENLCDLHVNEAYQPGKGFLCMLLTSCITVVLIYAWNVRELKIDISNKLAQSDSTWLYRLYLWKTAWQQCGQKNWTITENYHLVAVGGASKINWIYHQTLLTYINHTAIRYSMHNISRLCELACDYSPKN